MYPAWPNFTFSREERREQFIFYINFFIVKSATTASCLLRVNHILGVSWNVTVFKAYSNIVGKDNDRQNAKCVLAEKVKCTTEGDLLCCWKGETSLHRENAV